MNSYAKQGLEERVNGYARCNAQRECSEMRVGVRYENAMLLLVYKE